MGGAENKKLKKLPSFFLGLAVSPIIGIPLAWLWYTRDYAAGFWTLFIVIVGVPYFLWNTRIGQIIGTAVFAGTLIPALIWFWLQSQ